VAVLLQWASVGILRQDEYYSSGWSRPAGKPAVHWRTQATGWHIPVDLFPRPDDTRRTFQWQVRVVRERARAVTDDDIHRRGAAQRHSSFHWLVAQPTPPPPPTDPIKAEGEGRRMKNTNYFAHLASHPSPS